MTQYKAGNDALPVHTGAAVLSLGLSSSQMLLCRVASWLPDVSSAHTERVDICKDATDL